MKFFFFNFTQQKNFGLVLLIFSLPFTVVAQSYPYILGARAWGIADANIAKSDFTASTDNVAGLGALRETVLYTSYDSHYSFDGIATFAIGGCIPLSDDLGMGFSCYRFGDKLYNMSAISVGAGHQLGRIKLGVKINYIQNAVNAPSLTFSRNTLVVDFGGIVKFSKQLFLGAHINNLTQSKYSGDYSEAVPTLLRLGMMYKPHDKLTISTEIEKNTDMKFRIKSGLEYQIWEMICLRTGVATRPSTSHFGLGFKGANFYIDYAAHSHPHLGWSQHISIGYSLGQRGNEDESIN